MQHLNSIHSGTCAFLKSSSSASRSIDTSHYTSQSFGSSSAYRATMTSWIFDVVLKRVFNETTQNKLGSRVSLAVSCLQWLVDYHQDARYENVQVTTKNGKIKTIKQERSVPKGISNHNRDILNRVRRRAHRLDTAYSFCGFKCGISSVIGLVPA